MVHGDGGSVERIIIDSLSSRSFSQSSTERFEGVELCPQDFHKRGIALQVFYGLQARPKSGPIFSWLG